jgi:hypothetical protein
MIEGIWDKYVIGGNNNGPVRITLIRGNLFYISGENMYNQIRRYLLIDHINLTAKFIPEWIEPLRIENIIEGKAYRISSPFARFERYPPTPPPTPTSSPPTPEPTISNSFARKMEGIWYAYRNGSPKGDSTFYYIGNNTFYIDGLRDGQGIHEHQRYIKINPNTLIATYPYFDNRQVGKIILSSDGSDVVSFADWYYYDKPWNGFTKNE